MITFDGHDLESIAIVGSPSVTAANFANTLVEVPARDGSVVRGTRLGDPSVSMTIAIVGTDAERRRKVSTLLSWLRVDGAKHLVTPDDSSVYWLALPSGSLDMERLLGGETSVLAFDLVEPAAYGARRSVTVSGTATTFEVGGTYPTMPSFSGTVARDSSSHLWGIRLDGGDFVHVDTGTTANRSIVVDCAERTCKVGGTAKLPTLDSDWLSLAPGTHTVVRDNGTGNVTLTWLERWL
jgi:predicted phage tail component-like protein